MKIWWAVSVALVFALAGCDSDSDDGEFVGGDCGARASCTFDMRVDAALDAEADAGLDPDAELDGVVPDAAPDPDAGMEADAEPPAQLMVVEGHEHDIGGNWLSAGQPSEGRVRDLVALGARIISLRLPAEDPFDEAGLIEALGGTFTRYPTQASDYQQPAFREALYDIYDEHMAEPGPVYLHCASANRAGASWALYQAERLGVEPEAALELGRQAGMGSTEQIVRSVLGL